MSEKSRVIQPGEPVPDFALSTLSGETVRLSGFRERFHVAVYFLRAFT